MYNRYIRNDAGVYQRVPTQESQPGPPTGGERPRNEPPRQEAHQQPWEEPQQSGFSPSPTPRGGDGKQGFLSSLLGKLKLDEIDTGDLLLLVVLFLLFKDSEDEELLIALGLLLIL